MKQRLLQALLVFTTFMINGCVKEEEGLLPAECSKSLVGLSMPNAFTPNADGKNDGFRSLNTTGWTGYNITIYTLNNEVVFQSSDPFQYWDGKNPGGSLLTEPLYRYTLTVNNNGKMVDTCSYLYLMPTKGDCIDLMGLDPNQLKFPDQFNPGTGVPEYNTGEKFCF